MDTCGGRSTGGRQVPGELWYRGMGLLDSRGLQEGGTDLGVRGQGRKGVQLSRDRMGDAAEPRYHPGTHIHLEFAG